MERAVLNRQTRPGNIFIYNRSQNILRLQKKTKKQQQEKTYFLPPKCSIMGHLFFHVYINDIPEGLQSR